MTVYSPQILDGSALLLRALQSELLSNLGVRALSTIGTSTVTKTPPPYADISSINIDVEEDEAFFGVFNCNFAQDATPGTESYLRIVIAALENQTSTYKYNVGGSVETARGACAFGAFYQGEGRANGTPVTLTAQFGTDVIATLRSFNYQWLSIVAKKRKYNARIFA